MLDELMTRIVHCCGDEHWQARVAGAAGGRRVRGTSADCVALMELLPVARRACCFVWPPCGMHVEGGHGLPGVLWG